MRNLVIFFKSFEQNQNLFVIFIFTFYFNYTILFILKNVTKCFYLIAIFDFRTGTVFFKDNRLGFRICSIYNRVLKKVRLSRRIIFLFFGRPLQCFFEPPRPQNHRKRHKRTGQKGDQRGENESEEPQSYLYFNKADSYSSDGKIGSSKDEVGCGFCVLLLLLC